MMVNIVVPISGSLLAMGMRVDRRFQEAAASAAPMTPA